jgi:hypothetical protein
MPSFDETGWLIFWAGVFLSGSTLLFLTLYFRFTSRDETEQRAVPKDGYSPNATQKSYPL